MSTLARARLLLASLALVSCRLGDEAPTGLPDAGRYDRDHVERSLETSEPGVVVGVFPLAPKGVVDGDTIKVKGLDASLRLLGIDTEETFKNERDRRGYEEGFDVYLAKKAAQTSRPVKVATPMGEEAKVYAKAFFKGALRVKVERDHPKELRGRFDRYLAYVFVERDGKWVNFNVESVRAGMTPYFPKYGHSRRFKDEFLAAQEEAREKQLGIWDPSKEHYPDYDARLAWWTARGDFVDVFEDDAENRADHVVLGRYDALDTLAELEGREARVLGTVSAIRRSKRGGPTRVLLARKRGDDFPIIFFDERVFEASGIEAYSGEYVVVAGPVARYKHPKAKRSQLQIIVRNAGQVTLPDYTPPGPHTTAAKPEPQPEPEPEPEPEPAPEPAAPAPPVANPVPAPPAPAKDPLPPAPPGSF